MHDIMDGIAYGDGMMSSAALSECLDTLGSFSSFSWSSCFESHGTRDRSTASDHGGGAPRPSVAWWLPDHRETSRGRIWYLGLVDLEPTWVICRWFLYVARLGAPGGLCHVTGEGAASRSRQRCPQGVLSLDSAIDNQMMMKGSSLGSTPSLSFSPI